MAKRDPKEAGSALMQELLPILSESARDTVQAALLGNEQALMKLGEAAMRQQDYSRVTDALRAREQALKAKEEAVIARHEELKQWYEVSQGAIRDGLAASQQLARLTSGGTPPIGDENGDPPPMRPAPTPAPPAVPTPQPNYVGREEAQTALRESLNISSLLSRLVIRHFREFNDELDTDAVITYATENQIPLAQAYDLYVKPVRDQKQQEAVQLQLQEAEARGKAAGREEALKQLGTTMPYPVGNTPADVPLSVMHQALKTKVGEPVPDAGVAAAVADYLRLEQTRFGA